MLTIGQSIAPLLQLQLCLLEVWGMGKLIIEITNVHLLTNKIILRDWVVIHDENGIETYREIIKEKLRKDILGMNREQVINNISKILHNIV